MRPRLLFSAAVLLVAGAIWTEWRLHAQPSTTAAVWEYATVESFLEEYQFNRKISTANICFHSTSGCRWETIRTTVDRWGQSNDALVAASARLGEQGWEAVAATPSTDSHRATLVFKRQRTTE